MKKTSNFLRYTTGITLGLSLGLISKAPAVAFTVTQNNNANDLLMSLLGTTTGLSNFSSSVTGAPDAFGTFLNDPFSLGSGVVLSTGLVEELPGENILDDDFIGGSDLNTNLGTPGNDGSSSDLAQIDISFDADTSIAQNLFFQYVFGSEEFLEFGGSSFNDSFELLLNGVNLAFLTDGSTVTINNLVPTSDGLNNNPDYIDNPAAPGTLTRLDGYTKTLTFQGSLLNGSNTLSIRIKDVADAFLDSAVLIQGGTLSTVDPEPETIPEPASMLGLLAFGIFSMASVSKRKNN